MFRRLKTYSLPAARLSLLFGLFFLSACAYQLGTGAKPDFQKLHIAPVINETTNLPQATAILTTKIRETLARDGRVTLVNNPADADATLTLRINNYDRTSLISQRDDTGLTRKFSLNLEVRATLTKDGRTLFKDRPVRATQGIFLDNPNQPATYDAQLQAEYQALPQLAETLAQSLKHTLLDTW